MGSRSSATLLGDALDEPALGLACTGAWKNFAASAANSVVLSRLTRGRRGAGADAFDGGLTVDIGTGVGVVVLPKAVRDALRAGGGWFVCEGGLLRAEDRKGRLAIAVVCEGLRRW